ncbi:V-type ATP synthase subunit D [Candidatus Desantisbacteria bacterium CG_4_10_14_0_8_um_filter_48_22]|uniref:V-type ATP synthase subunit D n=1 Tax=Candidatus Desantisbacteria bacterium CG_4_10_14_0_8_um_filter_48_22 TaxID=1974543 RepID=A0A2M7SDQ3_9BACT|nr:MAG: hypothetical protein AUJ67_06300 [Candidatus Desantisbacteria bacterium CG1_02_49_89]PIV54598.1 MAG: V-type ATP synthase subunit D [Candidatus Desantisbacteria bacterium CG02_land_8_20_14_3_00_49_13]PIZ17667.1 MAG: V-type ATP synthase subunit D [Candidatus Desantisbacteria bacterium CG_4_10_14_0_8_um_filter_48_22]
MILAVNPTRMELLRLRKRILLARRGHKLLKDKQDELVRHFLVAIKDWKALRSRVEEGLARASGHFLKAYFFMRREVLVESLYSSSASLGLRVAFKRVTNLRLPVVSTEKSGDPFNYSFVGTTGDLDAALAVYCGAIKDIIELAGTEKSIMLLADEIKRTRRRVNALEYVLIPNLEETIRYISMKMEEFERSNLTQLMRVKEIVRAH